jgi:hypothetical protein
MELIPEDTLTTLQIYYVKGHEKGVLESRDHHKTHTVPHFFHHFL